jgi:hypothetical protein
MTEVLTAALLVIALYLAHLVRQPGWRERLAPRAVLACPACGLCDPALSFSGERCSPCAARDQAAEQVRRARRAQEHRAHVARRRAEDEERRRATRLPLLTVGSVYRNEHGDPVFDGFAFQARPDADGTIPPTIALNGRHPRGALICGWTADELHALAHGESCTCLRK